LTTSSNYTGQCRKTWPFAVTLGQPLPEQAGYVDSISSRLSASSAGNAARSWHLTLFGYDFPF
jgi:hypothetical protein